MGSNAGNWARFYSGIGSEYIREVVMDIFPEKANVEESRE